MDDWILTCAGGCRFGKLRFEISAPPLITMACHCTGCQKMSASAYSLSMAIPDGGFRVTEGEPVIGGLHDPRLHHRHCDHCKSWVFTEIEPGRGLPNDRPSMPHDFAWFDPFIESEPNAVLPLAQTGTNP